MVTGHPKVNMNYVSEGSGFNQHSIAPPLLLNPTSRLFPHHRTSHISCLGIVPLVSFCAPFPDCFRLCSQLLVVYPLLHVCMHFDVIGVFHLRSPPGSEILLYHLISLLRTIYFVAFDRSSTLSLVSSHLIQD